MKRSKIACKHIWSEAGSRNNQWMWKYFQYFLELYMCLPSEFVFLFHIGVYHFTGERTIRQKCWYTSWLMYKCCLSATNLEQWRLEQWRLEKWWLDKWSLVFKRGDPVRVRENKNTKVRIFWPVLMFCGAYHYKSLDWLLILSAWVKVSVLDLFLK